MRSARQISRWLARPAGLAVALLLTAAAARLLAHEGHATLPTNGARVDAGLREGGRGGAVTGQSLLEAENKLRQARNALAVARSKWHALGLPAGDLDALVRDGKPRPGLTLPVRSPIPGTVIHADLAV